MGGSLYWRDLISVVQEVSFSTPHLVSASHIEVHNCELKKKAGDISYASGTYRLFKLPKKLEMSSAIVTNKGTVSDYPCQLEFDSSHCFKKDAAGRRGAGCYLPVLSLLPGLLHPEVQSIPAGDKLGSSVNQCSKTGKAPGGCGET